MSDETKDGLTHASVAAELEEMARFCQLTKDEAGAKALRSAARAFRDADPARCRTPLRVAAEAVDAWRYEYDGTNDNEGRMRRWVPDLARLLDELRAALTET